MLKEIKYKYEFINKLFTNYTFIHKHFYEFIEALIIIIKTSKLFKYEYVYTKMNFNGCVYMYVYAC